MRMDIAQYSVVRCVVDFVGFISFQFNVVYRFRFVLSAHLDLCRCVFFGCMAEDDRVSTH